MSDKIKSEFNSFKKRVFEVVLTPDINSNFHERTSLIVVFDGKCNNKEFEAILNFEIGLSSFVDIFSDKHFTYDEIKHIRLKAKRVYASNDILNAVRNPNEIVKRYASEHKKSVFHLLSQDLFEKYNGTKIYLKPDIPFSERKKLYELGAIKDSESNCLYILSKNQNIEFFNEYLPS